jgi:hypothetical protein
MEFLDIKLTKGPSLLLLTINSPVYWRIFKENQTLVLKTPRKNPRNKKIRVYS